MMRALFTIMPVKRYLFVDEAWIIERSAHGEDADLAKYLAEHDGSISQHPDRKEIVMFCGEDAEFGTLMARRVIVRPANGRAFLAPLAFADKEGCNHFEGRMVGLLPRKSGAGLQ
jgi:hypothetical protein